MGVPKFFRYISERYPNLSELIGTKEMPEFDNLYLDMNGIFHNCSHPDDSNVHFRITEQQIFDDIFHYIDTILRLIQPQKLFFMAVDGVAPRAKMNQQRSRRFRSAKDANDLIEKAKAKGEVLPSENRFDSNCITPGTPFMARLQEGMKHFIQKKISSDPVWQKCRIILSGHETPGEGEHKIMEYIRYLKSKPEYDPNTRHCLYGLDADLIMLGLCTHERQFSLLREEVKFGKKAKRTTSVDETQFFLLNLGLLREYLALEFTAVKDKIKFGFEIERIIDDWVLMCFMVGNDFIPNLPNLHINSNALPILYKTYMEVLPTLDGYMNENGKLILSRLEKFMGKLADVDRDLFRDHYADIKEIEVNNKNFETFGSDLNEDTKNDLDAMIKATIMEFGSSDETDSSDGEDADSNFVPEENDESDLRIKEGESDTESDLSDDELFEREFKLHKRDYYITKLKYPEMTDDVLAEQTSCYITALQWTISYYYRGVCSWGWFYPHHYAPFISDIKNFKNLYIHLEQGKPFLPFQQLLSVLPADSREHLPQAYHKLMTHPSSKLIEYFPRSFETDLNGKKQDWEAVVLIPFIDADKLIDAMNECDGDLTEPERKRNIHGPMLQYDYTSQHQGSLPDSPYGQAGTANLFCTETLVYRDDIQIPEDKMIFGPCKGAANIDVYFPGFPTFRHHKHSSVLRMERVKVFDQPSRNESMIIKIDDIPTERTLNELAKYYVGREIFVGWPHLREAKVVGVSDTKNRIGSNDLNENYETQFHHHMKQIRDHHLVRRGIDLGEIKQLLHVVTMINREYIHTKDGKLTLTKKWSKTELAIALNTVVQNVNIFRKDLEKYRTIESVFTKDSTVFMLNDIYYGSQGKIIDPIVNAGRLKVLVQVHPQPNFLQANKAEHYASTYTNSYNSASSIGIDTRTFNIITGNVFIVTGEKRFPLPFNANKINIGLKLKSLKYNEQVGGYTRTVGKQWLYSQKVCDLVAAYHQRFSKIFVLLRSKPNPNDMIFESELNEGRSENQPSMLREISDWLKDQPHNNAPRQNIGSDSLENETVKSIVDAVESLKSSPYRSMRLQVKPHLLYKPNLNDITVEPDSRADFRIFDRVVIARDGYIVPLGARGTIIALHPHVDENPLRLENVNAVEYSYEILFDEHFPNGQSIGDIAVKRIFNVRQSVLINISYGLRRANQQKVEQPKINQQTVQRNDWRAPKSTADTPYTDTQQKIDANIWPNLNINGRGSNKYDKTNEQMDKNLMILRKDDNQKDNMLQKAESKKTNKNEYAKPVDNMRNENRKPIDNIQKSNHNIDLSNIPLPKQFGDMKISNIQNCNINDPSIIAQSNQINFASEDGCDALRRMLRIKSQTDTVPKVQESQPIDLNKLFGKPLPVAEPLVQVKVETTMLPKPPLDWHMPNTKKSAEQQQINPQNHNVPQLNNHQNQKLGQPIQYNNNPLNQFIQNQLQMQMQMPSQAPMQTPMQAKMQHGPPFSGPMPFMANNIGYQRMPVPMNILPQQPPPQQHVYHQYRGMPPFSQTNVRVVGPIAANFQSNPNQTQQMNRGGPKGPQTLNDNSKLGHGAFIPLQAARKSAKSANKNSIVEQTNISVLKKDPLQIKPTQIECQTSVKKDDVKPENKKSDENNKKMNENKQKKTNPKQTANRPKRLACKFDVSPE